MQVLNKWTALTWSTERFLNYHQLSWSCTELEALCSVELHEPHLLFPPIPPPAPLAPASPSRFFPYTLKSFRTST